MQTARTLPALRPADRGQAARRRTARRHTARRHTVRRHTVRRFTASAALAASAVLACAGTAAAHVGVDPEEAEKGGYSTVTFKVPNERDNASTVRLEVSLPTDHPLSSVMPQPVPGWDVEVTRSTLDKPVEVHGEKINEAITKITWSGGKVGPGRFQQFPVSMGQLPEDTDRLVFKALQTYDNEEIVRWIEEPKEGAAEPEHPAPVLRLTEPAEDAGHGGGTEEDADGGTGGAAEDGADAQGDARDDDAVAAGSSDSTDSTARVLAVIGIVAGVAGVAFGVLAGRRRSV